MERDVNKIPIIEQVLLSVNDWNLMAFTLGAVITGAVPLGTYVIAHQEVQSNPWMWVGVFFGAVFSLVTVYRWGLVMFRSEVRAVGYCALVEFGMIFSTIEWLSILLLGIVIFINAIAGGCALVLDWKDYKDNEFPVDKELELKPKPLEPDTPEILERAIQQEQRLRRGAVRP